MNTGDQYRRQAGEDGEGSGAVGAAAHSMGLPRATKKGEAMLSALKFLGGLTPWVVIAGLLYAAFFIQPQPTGETVLPPPLERRDRFNGVEVMRDGTLLWAVGSFAKIVRSEDAGNSWTVQDTTVKEHLQDIAAWDEQRAVAVGNDGVVMVTADGGGRWEPVEAPRSEIFNKLVQVIARPGGTAFAVGGFGAVLVSHDYGRSWARAVEERDVGWNGIAVAADGDIWVVGEFGELMSSADGGATWDPVEPIVQSSLMRVAFRPDNSQGAAVGLEGVVLLTLDGGENWERLETGGSAHLFDIAWIGDRWVASGDDGLVAYSNPENVRDWTWARIDPNERGWHTDLELSGDALYLAGASFGRLDRKSGEWLVFGNDSGDASHD